MKNFCFCFFIASFLLGNSGAHCIETALLSQGGPLLKTPLFFDPQITCLSELNINQNEFDLVRELEINENISHILLEHPELTRSDRMLLLWLSLSIKNAKSEAQAILNWRNAAITQGFSNDFLSSAQVEIINLPEDKIQHIYRQAREYIQKSEPGLTQELIVRTLKNQHKHNQLQIYQGQIRTLSMVKARKINVKILKDCLLLVKTICKEDRDIPIIEKLKNLKVFQINDFSPSKGSLISHDIFDHLWFAAKLEEEGIFQRYHELYSRLGNPHLKDIFSREGELYASIAFDFRSFQIAEPNYRPFFSIESIKEVLENSIQDKTSSANQKKALELIVSADEKSLFLKGLCYIFSGMAIELIESNRKHGFIRVLDRQGNPYGYFNFFDPEHVAFIVEAVHYLFKNFERNRQILINTTLLIEDHMSAIATQDNPSQFSIGLEDIEIVGEVSTVNISERKKEWIKRNLNFETRRYSIP